MKGLISGNICFVVKRYINKGYQYFLKINIKYQDMYDVVIN